MKIRQSLFAPAMLLMSWAVMRIQLASDTSSFAFPAQLTRTQIPVSMNPVRTIIAKPQVLRAPHATKLVQKFVHDSHAVGSYRREQENIPSGFKNSGREDTPIPSFADVWVRNTDRELIPPFPPDQPDPSLTALPKSQVNNNSRIGGSFWTLWRDGSSTSAVAENGQVGGSQTGIRLRLPVARLNQHTRVNMSARLSSPLSQSDSLEGSIGASLTLGSSIPIELIGERRFSVDKQSMARWSLTAASGVNEFKVGQKMQLDGYIQAGIVFANTKQGFVGGNAVLSQPVFHRDREKYRIGIGIWGDAQKGASRVDIGPDLTIKTAVAGTPLRLSGQWRFRLIGNARPASGPAIVLGGDF
jgi:hypothetical protein